MRHLRWALLMALVLLVAACGGDDDGDAAAGEANDDSSAEAGDDSDDDASDDDAGDDDAGSEPEDLRSATFVMATGAQIKLFPMSVAAEMGFFAEEGMDVDVVPVEGSGLVLQQLSTGGAEFGYAASEPTMLGYAETPTYKVAYEVWTEGTFHTYVPADSDITTVEELEGKTIGVDSLTTGNAVFTRIAVSSVGLDPNNDIAMEPIGSSPAVAAEAFRQGRIDAYTDAWESVMIIENAGVDLRCLTCDVVDVAPAAVNVNADFMDEHPELVEGMGRALAKAVEFAKANPEAAKDIMRSINPGEFGDEDLADLLMQETLKRMEPREAGRYGLLSRSAWETQMERLLSDAADPGLDEPVDLDEFLVFDFVDGYNDFDVDEVRALAESYEGTQ
jgi:NitT/TauT family transport system substrate-binding protein